MRRWVQTWAPNQVFAGLKLMMGAAQLSATKQDVSAALEWAALQGNVPAVKLLLKHGATFAKQRVVFKQVGV